MGRKGPRWEGEVGRRMGRQAWRRRGQRGVGGSGLGKLRPGVVGIAPDRGRVGNALASVDRARRGGAQEG